MLGHLFAASLLDLSLGQGSVATRSSGGGWEGDAWVDGGVGAEQDGKRGVVSMLRACACTKILAVGAEYIAE